MKKLPFVQIVTLTALMSVSLIAEESRQEGAHEHGVGKLDIAFDGTQVAMDFHAPGADIVGFEYEAKSAEDLTAIEKALETLGAPLALFELPVAAGCSVTKASAMLDAEDDHDEKHGHDDHNDEYHAEHDHEAHDEHETEALHAEFHAEYLLTCSNPKTIKEINFAYFQTFPNALEVEVQVLTEAGARSFEVERDEPTLDLRDLF